MLILHFNMKEINRILIQLNKAIECSNSALPQERAISVIIFDNLIEIQLYKRAEQIFKLDITTWFSDNRYYTINDRDKVLTYYDKLLKFSKDNKRITEEDFEILKYVHSIRNEVYHNGELNEQKIDLAIFIYFDFLKRTLFRWGSPTMLVGFLDRPSYRKIDFGQGIEDEFSTDHKKYFQDSLEMIFSKFKILDNLTVKVQTIINSQTILIRKHTQFINNESKFLNFYDVLGGYWYLIDEFRKYREINRKPRNLDSILIIYAFLREHKDTLDDISELKSRQKKGKILLREFRSKHKGRYPYFTNINRIEDRLNKMNGKSADKVLKSLIDIELKLKYLLIDLNNASIDLDCYLQYLSDARKGK